VKTELASRRSRRNPDNLVMGFATNQSEASLRVFCQSLRNVYSASDCDVVILTNKYESYFDDLSRIGIEFVQTPSNWSIQTRKVTKAVNRVVLHALRGLHKLNGQRWLPEIAQAYFVLIETWHHPQLARWFAYQRVLSVCRRYTHIFLADVRDVVFQAPFFRATDVGLTLFADAHPYGSCYWNDTWYREIYGRAALAKVRGRHPVCIGTVLGTQAAIVEMLDQFVNTIAASPFAGIEQAIFNHMLLECDLLARAKPTVVPNISERVATVASDEAVEIRHGQICRRADQTVIPVVHMYDRWPAMVELCLRKYGLPFADGVAEQERLAV
jgi:hypothetical protein